MGTETNAMDFTDELEYLEYCLIMTESNYERRYYRDRIQELKKERGKL